jgi:hypothetical protein
LAWRDSAFRDAADRPSRFSFRRTARERLGDGRVWWRPARLADAALRWCGLRARWWSPSLTPARRAFDKPMAIACSVERAPCLPSRM